MKQRFTPVHTAPRYTRRSQSVGRRVSNLSTGAIALGMIAAATFAPNASSAGAAAKPASVADDSRGERALQLLKQLESASGDRAARLNAVDDLVGLAPIPVKTLENYLKRERASDEGARKTMLSAIGASIPDAKGKFKTPGREAPRTLEEADNFDWIAELVDKPASPTVGDLVADIATIRALARSEHPSGAAAALRFGFSAVGTLYRDEVGRHLRRGAPFSVPALFRGLHSSREDIRRYSKYQLERADREAPHKALRAAADNEALAVEIINAWSETLHREAVYVLLETVDSDSVALRAAARRALVHFAETKPAKPAPARRLSLPGGGFTKSASKLFLDHQTLTGIELRSELEKRTGVAPDENANLPEMAKKLFGILDSKRAASTTSAFDAGRKAADAGEFAIAAAKFDEVLVRAPEFDKKPEMAATFLAHGKELESTKNFRGAAIAFRKAHELDPNGPLAKDALSQAHVARARLIASEGGDSAVELAKARGLDPSAGNTDGSQRKWMVFIGLGAAAAGLFLVLAGAFARRRR